MVLLKVAALLLPGLLFQSLLMEEVLYSLNIPAWLLNFGLCFSQVLSPIRTSSSSSVGFGRIFVTTVTKSRLTKSHNFLGPGVKCRVPWLWVFWGGAAGTLWSWFPQEFCCGCSCVHSLVQCWQTATVSVQQHTPIITEIDPWSTARRENVGITDTIFTRSQVFNETSNNADGFSVAKYNRNVMDTVYLLLFFFFFSDPFTLEKRRACVLKRLAQNCGIFRN